MEPDLSTGPGRLTSIGWFFWAGWNRLLCWAFKHAPDENAFCERCGLPL